MVHCLQFWKIAINMLKKQIIKYEIVGGISTLIHIGAATFFVRFINNSLMIANSFAFAIAYLFSYFTQSKIVFKSSVTRKKAIKFFIVQVISLILSVKLAELAVSVSIYLKIFIVALLLPLSAFIIHRFWTFVDSSEESEK